MFQCDCVVVGVDFCWVGFDFFELGYNYWCECFVDFDGVDVVDGKFGFVQCVLGGGDGFGQYEYWVGGVCIDVVDVGMGFKFMVFDGLFGGQ